MTGNVNIGELLFDSLTDVFVEVDGSRPAGEKITRVYNPIDGQDMSSAASGKNAIIKQATQTVNEDFKVEFEVELTEEEAAFARATTKRAIIFLCRDAQNRPAVLNNIGRKQTSYVYYITTENGFLAVYTNNSGTDTLAAVFEKDATQVASAALIGNKIIISLENKTQETYGKKLGYVKLPDDYSWDVKVIAF